MKGDFQITLAYLKEIGACREGQREFQKHFPDGGGYQEVLDKCAELDRYDLGSWLLDKLGPTDDVRVYEEEINDPRKTILFAGRLEFRRSVSVKRVRAGRVIKAGESIKAGCGIEAGWSIKAGWSIEAGCGITAGEGYGIFAGLSIRIPDWPVNAVVTAKEKPENLISGHWKEPEEGSK